MRGLQPVHRVGRPQLSRLHHNGKQSGRQRENKNGIPKPTAPARYHAQGVSEKVDKWPDKFYVNYNRPSEQWSPGFRSLEDSLAASRVLRTNFGMQDLASVDVSGYFVIVALTFRHKA